MAVQDDYIAEGEAFLAELGPRIEGCEDILRWNIQDETRSFYDGILLELREKRRRLSQALDAVRQVGPLELPQREARPGVLEDIQQNQDSVALAKGLALPVEPATSLNLAAGTIEPK